MGIGSDIVSWDTILGQYHDCELDWSYAFVIEIKPNVCNLRGNAAALLRLCCLG